MLTRIKITARAKTLEYAIRDVVANANAYANSGRKVFYLNIGDPVAFDFPTPAHITKALVEAVQKGENYYSPSEGLPELRQAVAEKEKAINGVNLSPEDIVITAGVSEGIRMVLATLVEEGDEILVPGPA